MARCGSCPCKIFVWIVWTIHVVLCIVYSALALSTFHQFNDNTKIDSSDANVEAYRVGILAALMLGFLNTVLWIICSFFILIGRYFGEISMVYGMMLGWGWGIAFFQLLAGLVVQSAEHWAKALSDNAVWDSNALQAYYATFAFSYILIVSFVITITILWLACNQMRKEGDTVSAPAASGPSLGASNVTGNKYAAPINPIFGDRAGKGMEV